MNDGNQSKDGKFDLYYKNGYAELIVYPSMGDGLPVYHEDVESRMKILGIQAVRLQILVNIINEATSTPIPLVEWPDGRKLSAHIKISINNDYMSAEAEIDPPKIGGGELTVEDVYKELDNLNIKSGIDDEKIQSVLSQRDYNRAFLIASGQFPEDGKESEVAYHFETQRVVPFLEMKYGRINLKELNFIQNCNAGDLLAHLEPLEKPIDGYNIKGEVFKAKTVGITEELFCGNNAYIEGNQVFASIKGNVIINDGLVEVEKIVTVNNVDYETGNIDFDGSVNIKGTIADGFSVKATGDIQVGKCVGRVHIYSERNVVLKAGINGDQEGFIECHGDLISKYIESSTIKCGKDLLIEEAVLHSHIDVVGHLLLSGRRAELIGGLSIVGGLLHCKKIGNLYDSKTNLIIGIHPQLIESFFKAQKELDKTRKKLDKLDEQFAQLKGVHLQDEERVDKINRAVSKVERDIKETYESIATQNHAIQILRSEMIPSPKSYILAEDRIFGGVKISFALEDHPVPDKGISSSIIYLKGKNITELGYNRTNPQLPEELENIL